MASERDVARFAMALPDVEQDRTAWQVHKKTFVWLRELRKADLAALGEDAPTGPLIGVRVADEGEKFALIEQNPAVYLTTPHFDGYPAVLVQLDHIDLGELREIITDAWLSRAPRRLAAAYLAAHPQPERG